MGTEAGLREFLHRGNDSLEIQNPPTSRGLNYDGADNARLNTMDDADGSANMVSQSLSQAFTDLDDNGYDPPLTPPTSMYENYND